MCKETKQIATPTPETLANLLERLLPIVTIRSHMEHAFLAEVRAAIAAVREAEPVTVQTARSDVETFLVRLIDVIRNRHLPDWTDWGNRAEELLENMRLAKPPTTLTVEDYMRIVEALEFRAINLRPADRDACHRLAEKLGPCGRNMVAGEEEAD